MKQETTLEEAGVAYAKTVKENHTSHMLGFHNGAKWQEQQTIEEVFEWLTTNNYLTDLKKTMIKDFNRFKINKMKNIHLVPTDKPSRLYLDKGKIWLDDLVYGDNNQHIYIASDEEIKEGDWYMSIDNFVRKADTIWNTIYGKCPNKKIILTTDQDLIKDGVQAIDDAFLEWFVKNPSCESIEVLFACRGIDVLKGVIGEYRIMFPKEEPKQETLEEASHNYASNKKLNKTSHLIGFREGAKWQEQNSYSEEDLKEAFFEGWIARDGKLTFTKAKNKWFKNK